MTPKVNRNTKKIFILSVLLFAAGCSSSSGQRSIEDLKSAPESLKLGGIFYVLYASVWRDLMPTIDTSLNKGISVSLELHTSVGSPSIDSMKALKIYVVNNNSLWETDSLIIDKSGGKMKEVIAHNGPLWEPGSKVTAVLEFKYAGQIKLLSSGETEIKSVY